MGGDAPLSCDDLGLQGLNGGSLRSRLRVKSGRGQTGARGAADISLPRDGHDAFQPNRTVSVIQRRTGGLTGQAQTTHIREKGKPDAAFALHITPNFVAVFWVSPS